MPRFYYESEELIDGSWAFTVYDRRRSNSYEIASCEQRDDAERIVNALNAMGVFG